METKKLLVSVALSLAFASSALIAEESGVFVGVGVGYGASAAKISVVGESVPTQDFNGMSYEVIAGYKQFFTPSFGLRYYANFVYAQHKVKDSESDMKIDAMNYGVNVDALYNFVSSGDTNIGAFLGLGVGAMSFGGKDLKDQKMDKTGFNLALNVGLRSEFAKHHGVEIAARVPFIATTLADDEIQKVTAKENYNVGVRYIFSF